MDPLLWLALAIIVAVILFSVPYIQTLFTGRTPDQGAPNNNIINEPPLVVGGARRRPRGLIQDDDVNNEQVSAEPKKIGTKKQRKLAEKAEKKALREQEEALREDEKKRDALRQEELQKKEQELAILNEKKKQEEKERKEKQEREEHEQYLKLKSTFVIEEEGSMNSSNDSKTLKEFVNYIKTNKVIVIEDIAAKFNMRAQDAIDRIHHLQDTGQITGVIDDRGKFIYITVEELQSVAKFIRQRGRVSITELVLFEFKKLAPLSAKMNDCSVPLYQFLRNRKDWRLIWFAAHCTAKLTRRQCERISLPDLCSDLIELSSLKKEWLSLRVLALLLSGSIFIFDKQVYYIYVDVKQIWSQLSNMKFLDNSIATCTKKSNQVTLIDPLLFIDSFSDSLADITIPSECEFFSVTNQSSVDGTDLISHDHIVANQSDITLSEDHSYHSLCYEISDDFDGNEIFKDPIPIIDGTPRPTTGPLEFEEKHSIVSEVTPTSLKFSNNENVFISPLADIEHVTQSPKVKRKLAFDVVTKLSNEKKKQSSQQRTAIAYYLQKKPSKKLLSEPTLDYMRSNKTFFELWQRNLFDFKKVDNDISNDTESMDVEVLRRGTTSYEETWANATPIYTDISEGILSVNHSNEFDFISSSAYRALETHVNLGNLSPIVDRDDEDYETLLSNSSVDSVDDFKTESQSDTLLRKITKAFGAQHELKFDSLVPKNVERLMVANMFSNMLELVQRGIISADQRKPYSHIVLTKGINF